MGISALHLLCDLQGQANKWVKNMEAQTGLRVLNLAMPDLLRQMENAIQFGSPVLLQVSTCTQYLQHSGAVVHDAMLVIPILEDRVYPH